MNALMGDLGFADPKDLVTKDKVRKLKLDHGFSLQVEHEETTGYEFIGFDGKLILKGFDLTLSN